MSSFAKAVATIVVVLPLTLSASAAEPLFVKPLHLTRQIQDPFSDKAVVIEEYCFADRVVSVRGRKVSIADYGKGELTQIDHERGTYSVTTFEQIAAANSSTSPAQKSARTREAEWSQTVLPSRGVAGRTSEVVELKRGNDEVKERLELALDPSTTISRSAFEVLTGAAYPSRRNPQHDAIANAAARRGLSQSKTSVASSEEFALPVEQITEYQMEGEKLRTENRVLRIDSDLPSPELLILPATRVESPIVERQRLLEELDRLPSSQK